jgi:hypothetical protein
MEEIIVDLLPLQANEQADCFVTHYARHEQPASSHLSYSSMSVDQVVNRESMGDQGHFRAPDGSPHSFNMEHLLHG